MQQRLRAFHFCFFFFQIHLVHFAFGAEDDSAAPENMKNKFKKMESVPHISVITMPASHTWTLFPTDLLGSPSWVSPEVVRVVTLPSGHILVSLCLVFPIYYLQSLPDISFHKRSLHLAWMSLTNPECQWVYDQYSNAVCQPLWLEYSEILSW